MTPRERRERAKRAAVRGPIYEGIGYGLIVVVITVIAFPVGLLFMLYVSVALLVLGLLVGLIRGPVKTPRTPGDIPPA